MKKTIVAAVLLLLANAFAAFSSDKDTKTIQVPAFDSISCNVACDIKYETGAPKVILYADPVVLDKLSVTVEDRELKIKMPEKKLRRLKGVTIYITSNVLNSLTCNGACEFENKNGIVAPKSFSLACNGACDCEIASVHTNDISIAINGVGDCEVKGIRCKTITAVINGAGDLDLEGQAQQADLTINGAGDIDIDDLFVEKVNSTIHGAGSIARK